jgi:hypothetical protein
MKISEHFTLEELSFSETAARLGLDNTPTASVVKNLVLVAAEWRRALTVSDGLVTLFVPRLARQRKWRWLS